MRRMKRIFQSTTKRLQQRGSALLASLMVIVGLSLLGLAFVAISETESAISINERNHTQTVALAEAGARLVVQWFQAPDQMLTLGLMPANNAANSVFKRIRDIGTSQTVYKSGAGQKLSGAVPLVKIAISSPAAQLSDLSEECVSCAPDTPDSEVAALFDKYNLVTLAVADEHGRLAGIITADDVISMLRHRS